MCLIYTIIVIKVNLIVMKKKKKRKKRKKTKSQDIKKINFQLLNLFQIIDYIYLQNTILLK